VIKPARLPALMVSSGLEVSLTKLGGTAINLRPIVG